MSKIGSVIFLGNNDIISPMMNNSLRRMDLSDFMKIL